MKFAEVIREAGLNPCNFENSSNIDISLYDGKDQISSEESIHYVEPFFKNNEGALKNFKGFITGLEKETVESMNIKIDINSVILFYKTTRAIVFLRNPPLDPMDYRD